MSSKPLCHLFTTITGNYLFDTNTNTILKIEKTLYQDLSNYLAHDGSSQYCTIGINNLKSKGYLSNKKVLNLIHPDDALLEQYLGRKLNSLILQVTQNCNLRCTYCPYTNPIEGNQRTHENKRMKFTTAKKAIDFLLTNSSDSDTLTISFYGGEPLLEFKLIKKCVEYAKTIGNGKVIHYHMTTNGTLLSEEVINYLEKNRFILTISIDGEKSIHDRNRVYHNSDKGSFDTIIHNLENIQKNHALYYNTIGFNTVLDTESDFICNNNFFKSCIFDNSRISSSIVSQKFNKTKKKLRQAFKSNYEYEEFKIFLYYMNEINMESISPLLRSLAMDLLNDLISYGNKMYELPDDFHHSGPCIPGQRRLFVDVDGNFYPCERLSECISDYKIGSVDDGFDINKVRAILNIGKLTENECKNCWAIMHCSQCAKAAQGGTKISKNAKLKSCLTTKTTVQQSMIDYVILKELGCDFSSKIYEMRHIAN